MKDEGRSQILSGGTPVSGPRSCTTPTPKAELLKMNKYQGVKNFTLVARMQNSSSILRATDESSMF